MMTKKTTACGENDYMIYGTSAMQGRRLFMEDAHTNVLDHPVAGTDVSFFGIFDGHGGWRTAKYISETLHVRLFEDENRRVRVDRFDGLLQLDESIEDSFIACNAARLAKKPLHCDYDGSGCACIAACVFAESPTKLCVVVTNVGDSRAVLFHDGVVRALSQDHKPTVIAEQKHIIFAGGHVESGRVNGILSLSRAFGNPGFQCVAQSPREQVVPCVPTIQRAFVSLVGGHSDHSFLLLACDGIWDVFSNEDACQYVASCLRDQERGGFLPLEELNWPPGQYDLVRICNDLVDKAVLGRGSTDNCSATIIHFKRQPTS